MRTIAFVFAIALAHAGVTAAQMPMQPQQQEPLKFLPVAEVNKQIEEARGAEGMSLPTKEARQKVVAEVNGQTVTWQELLDEVVSRFGGPLETGLLNQAAMHIAIIKRQVTITDDEFVQAVRTFLAQKKTVETKETLRQVLEAGRIDWKSFERMISEKAKLAKLVRKDLKMKGDGDVNPLVVQIWAGQKLRGTFTMEMDRTKLPAGAVGKVASTRMVSDMLEDLPAGEFKVSVVPPVDVGKPGLVLVEPVIPGPRYEVPNLQIQCLAADGSAQGVAADEAIKAALAGVTGVRRYYRVARADGKGDVLEFPRSDDLRKRAGGKGTAEKILLADAVKALGGDGYTVEARVWLNDRFDLPDAPVTMAAVVDKEAILALSFGSLLKPEVADDALKSLSRFMAVKRAFKAKGIAVDEKAVAALIAAENAKYNHPLFNRKMILQAQGKTVFDEDRRLWVGNGVDQIIGTDLDEATLRAHYEKNILHFGGATVEVSHILADARDPKTGKVDYERARRRIDDIAAELFASRNPASVFAAVAKRHSEDKTSAGSGGKLGPIPYKNRVVKAFAEAAFALRPREVSAPVKTVHGYHLILCEKVTPPDREKYAFDKPEIREQVRDDWQQERRDAWLEQNAYALIEAKKLAADVFTSTG